MKYVIEMDEEVYKARKRGDISPWITGPILDAVANGKPLDSVLDEIKAKIDAESAKSFRYPNWERAKALEWALSIIDKYKRG